MSTASFVFEIPAAVLAAYFTPLVTAELESACLGAALGEALLFGELIALALGGGWVSFINKATSRRPGEEDIFRRFAPLELALDGARLLEALVRWVLLRKSSSSVSDRPLAEADAQLESLESNPSPPSSKSISASQSMGSLEAEATAARISMGCARPGTETAIASFWARLTGIMAEGASTA